PGRHRRLPLPHGPVRSEDRRGARRTPAGPHQRVPRVRGRREAHGRARLMPETYVVAGANLAGGTAAATLRGDGFEGRVVLVGEEPVAPYERPPLSKEFLRGEAPFEKALTRPPGFWEATEIECLFGSRVTRID